MADNGYRGTVHLTKEDVEKAIKAYVAKEYLPNIGGQVCRMPEYEIALDESGLNILVHVYDGRMRA